jgi:tetratricopeptide (TPR) repeat protein
MGKIILCSGIRTKRPYAFAPTGIRIYSIEELCYYLYNNVYSIEEGMFSDSFIDWIGTELKLTDRADKLKQLKEQKADIKTVVTAILCSSDYYTEEEIKNLIAILDDIIGMPVYKRRLMKAKHFLKNNKYTEAAVEYQQVLLSEEAADLTPEEYGDILHNMAVAKVHMNGLSEAIELFRGAFERNHREESLKQYLYSLKLSNNDKLFIEKLEEYQVSEERKEEILSFLEQQSRAVKQSAKMLGIQQLKLLKIQDRYKEYDEKLNEILEDWKEKVRKST